MRREGRGEEKINSGFRAEELGDVAVDGSDDNAVPDVDGEVLAVGISFRSVQRTLGENRKLERHDSASGKYIDEVEVHCGLSVSTPLRHRPMALGHGPPTKGSFVLRPTFKGKEGVAGRLKRSTYVVVNSIGLIPKNLNNWVINHAGGPRIKLARENQTFNQKITNTNRKRRPKFLAEKI